MSAALAELAREMVPMNTAKFLASVFGYSIRSGKRHAAHPETFPKSRAEELLLHLEEVQRRQEQAIAERRLRLERLRHEISAELAMGQGERRVDRTDGSRQRAGGSAPAGRRLLPAAGEAVPAGWTVSRARR